MALTPEQLINDGRTYANTTLTKAQTALDAASTLVSAVGYIIPTPYEVDPGELEAPAAPGEPPDITDRTLNPPEAPGPVPEFQEVGEIDTGTMPDARAERPTFFFPVRPGPAPDFTAKLPEIETDAQFPEPPPQLENPNLQEPEIKDREVPVKPDINLPVFNGTVPTFTDEAPKDLPEKMAQIYGDASPNMIAVMEDWVWKFIDKALPGYHDGMARIEAQLQRFFDGGTGFTPAVEDAMYERARDKGTAEYLRVERSAYAGAAARGFTIPDAAALAMNLQARQGLADNAGRQATEIIIKQAELEQANLQFAVTQSSNLRQWITQAAMNYHQSLIQINGQALDYAKAVLAQIVQAYELALKAYMAKLDGLRAEVAVYEAAMKGALALIDIYESEIRALQALTQVDVAKIGVLRARVDVLQALANVYRTRIDAVLGKAEYEKMKIERFGMQVNAFRAQVDASNAEWGGYKAALDGNDSLAKMYIADIDADNQRLSGWKTKIDAQGRVLELKVQANRGLADQHDSALRTYETLVRTSGEVIKTQVDVDKVKLSAWSESTRAKLGYASALADNYRVRSQVLIHNASAGIQAQDLHQKSLQSFQGTIAQLAGQAAGIYGSVSQSALSGMNSVVTKMA